MNSDKTKLMTCPKHGLTTYVERFDGRYRCRKCTAEKTSEHRRKMKEKLIEYKGGKCEICGYDKCYRSLCFHHIDPSKKDFGLSSLSFSQSLKKCMEEADKCILVCANCHGEIHDKIDLEKRNTEMEEQQLNLGNYTKHRHNFIDNEEIVQSVKNFLSEKIPQKEIARRLNISWSCVKRIINKHSLEHSGVILFNSSKEEIIDCLKNCKSFNEASSKFGITRETLRKACKKFGLPTKIKQYKGM